MSGRVSRLWGGLRVEDMREKRKKRVRVEVEEQVEMGEVERPKVEG